VGLRVAATAGVFALIFSALPAGEIGAAMTRVGGARWGIAALLFGAVHAIGANKWRILVRLGGVPLDLATALRAHAAGLFANIWLPSLIGGDVVRAAWVARSHGGLAVPALAGVADRALDLAALLLLGALGAWLAPADALGPAAPVLRAGTLALALAAAAGVALLFSARAEALAGRFGRVIARAREVLTGFARRPALSLLSLLLAVVTQGSFVALNVWLGQSVGVDPGLAAWLLAWPLSKVVAMVGPTLGGLGVREAALAGLLAPFGVPATLAVAQGLVWQSVLFGFGLVAGVVVFATQRVGAR
jgi:hypothetical protein